MHLPFIRWLNPTCAGADITSYQNILNRKITDEYCPSGRASYACRSELINIILNEAGNPPPHKAKITAVSLLFKDLSYSAEKGWLPSCRNTDYFTQWWMVFWLHYRLQLYGDGIPRTWKEIDISWSQQYVFLAYVGDLPVNAGRSCLNSGNPTLFSITAWTSTPLPFSGKLIPLY